MQRKNPGPNQKNNTLYQWFYALPGYGRAALIALATAETLLFAGVRPAGDFFYLFVWWPYIFLADAMISARQGRSPIFTNFRAFLYLLPWSTTIWLVFEFFNFRLSNWHYINLVPFLPVRWAGYALSFATVLPGIFITAELLRVYGWFSRKSCPQFPITAGLVTLLQAAGGLMLILPMYFPEYFFPFVWGGFVLLLDPVNMRLGAPSLLMDLSQGRPQRVFRLLAAGMICGFLWEFWNFWATAKWIYTVPFVGDMKIFEMPVAGFLGFPPFALECFVMYTFLSVMGGALPPVLEDFRMKPVYPVKLTTISLCNAFFWIPAFYLIDKITVISLR